LFTKQDDAVPLQFALATNSADAAVTAAAVTAAALFCWQALLLLVGDVEKRETAGLFVGCNMLSCVCVCVCV
jgi:hypothetical protein